MPLPKVKYWASSPRAISPQGVIGQPEHAILMTVQQGRKASRTVRIATCINGAVSKRIAELLDKHESGA